MKDAVGYGRTLHLCDSFNDMRYRVKIASLVLVSLVWGLVGAQALEVDIYVSRPPGLIKFVYPQYPASLAVTGVSGKGMFLLKVNPKTGQVDEVKVLKSCGYSLLNELAAKALLQWVFRPGTVTQIKVPVEFYAHGFSRDIH